MLTFKSLLTLQTIYLLLLYNLAKINNTTFFCVHHKYFMVLIWEFHIFARVCFAFSNRQQKATVSIEYEVFVFIFYITCKSIQSRIVNFVYCKKLFFSHACMWVISTHKMYDGMCNPVLVSI